MLLRLTDGQKFASKLNWQVLENLKSSLLTVEAVLLNTIFFEHPESLQPHKGFDRVVCPGSLIMRKKKVLGPFSYFKANSNCECLGLSHSL